MKNKITLLIDADSLIYFVAHLETFEEAILKLNKRVSDIMIANDTNKYIMFLTGSDCFRYDVAKHAPYKGNRKDKERPRWMKAIKEYMIANYNALVYPKLEADDLVIFFNKIAYSRICAIDKDILLTTPGEHFNYGMKKIEDTDPQEYEFKGFVGITEKEAKYGTFMQMLTGDSVDNIPGIEGVGPAKAAKMLKVCPFQSYEELILNAYINNYGSVEGITRFAETFRLVYMLRTDDDMIREVGYVPETPEIQTFVFDSEEEEETPEWG